MFGSLGGPELLLILVVALLVFGPKKIPELSRTIGRGIAEFRRATNAFKSTLEHEVSAAEPQEDLKATDPKPKTTPAAPEQTQGKASAGRTDTPPAPSSKSPSPKE
ncbi:MAG: twin-arginine translocase TatA/TatE family subunit [Acidobacteria bacterium]|nr:MAG: twin-arginine translocase TatA/TatE family subunit [Acidobacteriota bacterium]